MLKVNNGTGATILMVTGVVVLACRKKDWGYGMIVWSAGPDGAVSNGSYFESPREPESERVQQAVQEFANRVRTYYGWKFNVERATDFIAKRVNSLNQLDSLG